MTVTWRTLTPQVRVTPRPDGGVQVDNAVALGPVPANLVGWLHDHAAATPDKAFLRQREPGGGWREVTFGEAQRIVDGLSSGLVAAGLADAPLAILSENSIEMGLASLAAMQIGTAVVPISNAYSVRSATGDLVEHLLRVARPATLLVSDAGVHARALGQAADLRRFAVSGAAGDVTPLADLVADGGLSPEARARADAVHADTLAKIQFTSGSTDLPKGVECTHGMLASNQVGLAQMWPSVGGDDVLVDWLPWNHTFGGNFVFDLALRHGCTLHLDHGNPTPAGLGTTAANLVDVRPTLYFSVPAGYTALAARMRDDATLRKAFFDRLQMVFVAAAALDQRTYATLKAMSAEVRGEPVPFLSAWGATETSPCATVVYWETDEARVIGLPIPGVSVALAPVPGGKRELRVRGPNVTRGYHRNPEATARAFDEDGAYRSGDAGAFLDEDDPARGLVFDGRIGEDFKLASGVWVRNAALRGSVHTLGQPLLAEVVPTAPNRPWLGVLVFPNTAVLRARLPEVAAACADDAALCAHPEVVAAVRGVLAEHNATATGSSTRIRRFTLLTAPPALDRNETTDKGYVNQRAVLTNRAHLVDALYADPPGPGVIEVP